MSRRATIPLSLYIHFPWCIKKCPYCDFNSHTKSSHFSEQRYVAALLKDIDHDLSNKDIHDDLARPLVSIFMGGGTPSLFSSSAIKSLLNSLAQKLSFSADIEITLESNPGSSEYDNFAGYRDAGVNRLSLGIQSFDDQQLKNLGRIHDRQTAHQAIKNAQSAGFENINLDIMYGLPNQTIEAVKQECDIATDYHTPHLSFYQLTIEPNTLFFQQPPKLPKEEKLIDMQQTIQQHTDQCQLQQYEISAYSKQGYNCRHNLNYWQFGDYLGIGAGAHSKITTEQGIKRFWKQKHPANYMQQIEQNNNINHISTVAKQEINLEFLMNALRLKQGVELSQYENTTGEKSSALLKQLLPFQQQQLITVDDNRIKCTPRGYQLLDEILQTFLP